MQTVLSGASAALFLAAAALSLRALFLPDTGSCSPQDRRGERTVFLAALLLGALMAGAVVLRAMALFPGAGPLEALGRFFSGGLLDARHYRSLALWGYGRGEDFFDQQLMIVFFPLFPWLMRLICLTGLPFYPAAMTMNLLLFAAGAALTFRITARRWGQQSLSLIHISSDVLSHRFSFAFIYDTSLFILYPLFVFSYFAINFAIKIFLIAYPL